MYGYLQFEIHNQRPAGPAAAWQPGGAGGQRVCWSKEEKMVKAGRGGLAEFLEEVAVRDLVLACLALGA